MVFDIAINDVDVITSLETLMKDVQNQNLPSLPDEERAFFVMGVFDMFSSSND
jgi:hypothetical protein